MNTESMEAYCAQCRQPRVFAEVKINHRLHLILSLATGGLWLAIWMAAGLWSELRPWRCRQCGWHKPESRPLQPPSPGAGQGCRVRPIEGVEAFADCLEEEPRPLECGFGISFGKRHICRHPDWKKWDGKKGVPSNQPG
jgi:hypothetical protein